jgi:beta-lactamase regulating signal transducer with metallopeptidase domain/Leucine-rich repeat (LRR) protein
MIALTKILLTLPPLLSILLKITIILGLGWTLHFLLARRNPRWRVLLWRGVVAGVVLVPILVPLKYLQVPVTLPPEPAERTVIPQPLTQTEPPALETFDSPREIVGTPPLASVPDSPPPTSRSFKPHFSISTWARENIYPMIFSVWALIALLITARFLTVLVKIRKDVKSSLPAPNHLQHLLDEVADNLNCSQKITLRYSHEFTSPFLAGLTRPVIILPKKMVAAEHIDELPAILAHEVAHLRSQDLLWMFATRWLSVVLWFHPLIWKLRDVHSTACEEVCDAVAADYVGNAESYSSTLARIALAIVGRVPAVAGIPMARSSEIIGRLRILKRKVYSSAPARRWVALSLLVGCVALATIGGLSLVYAESPHNSQPAEIASAGVGGVAKQVKDGPVGRSATRVIHFPKDRMVGVLYTVDVGFPAERPFPEAEPRDWLFGYPGGFGVDNCRPLGLAQGEVRVPADKMIRLDLYPGAWKNGRVFAGLKPDDIQILSLFDADDSTMQDIGRLTGLEALSLLKRFKEGKDVIDGRGLRHLTGLKKLKCLLLPAEIRSEDLVHITELPSLKYLYFRGPMITDYKMALIGKMTSLEELYLLDSEVGLGLKHLGGLKSLRRLSLQGNKSRQLDQGMACLADLTKLEELDLELTYIGDAGLAHLKGLNKLKRLYLMKSDTTRREITDKGMAHLSGLAALEKLILPWGVTDEGLAHLSRSDSLKELVVSGDGFGHKGLELISGMKSLRKLSIGVNKNITDADMAALARCTGLKELDLRYCPVTDAGFAQLKSLKYLKKLTIYKTKITGEGLAVLKQLPSLTELKLVSMTLGENGLAHLEGVTSLERFELASAEFNISDDELKHIGTLTNLKRLDILTKDARQPFTNVGFSHLSRLTGLQWLRLGGNNNITNDAFKHLAKLTALEHLILDQCEKISDAALKHLEGLTSLRFLLLDDSRVTEAGIARLKKKIPTIYYAGGYSSASYRSDPPEGSGYRGYGSRPRKPQRRPPRSRR